MRLDVYLTETKASGHEAAQKPYTYGGLLNVDGEIIKSGL